MPFLKQHRKATLEIDNAGRKLTGKFEVSLTNHGDRETLMEWINEVRKQLRLATPTKKKGNRKLA